jgi:hypothetical protein
MERAMVFCPTTSDNFVVSTVHNSTISIHDEKRRVPVHCKSWAGPQCQTPLCSEVFALPQSRAGFVPCNPQLKSTEFPVYHYLISWRW